MAGNKRKTKTIPIKFVDVYLDDAQIEQFKNEGFDALKQLKGIYTDKQIQWMLNNISKNEDNAEELPYAQKGGLVNQAKKSYIDVELSARDIAKYKALGFKIKDLT